MATKFDAPSISVIFLCVVDVQLCGIARYSSKSYNIGIARNSNEFH